MKKAWPFFAITVGAIVISAVLRAVVWGQLLERMIAENKASTWRLFGPVEESFNQLQQLAIAAALGGAMFCWAEIWSAQGRWWVKVGKSGVIVGLLLIVFCPEHGY
jgi:hypothetical protein